MFTQECFIRCCDKELIDALKELGYKDYTIHIKQLFQGITTTKDGQILGSNIPTTINSTCYDCGENKELFLALVAMRDDSDKDQYFVRDEEQRWIDANEVDDQLECSHYDEHSVGIPFDLDKYEDYKAKHKAKAKFDIEKYRKLHEDVKEFDKPSENYDDITVEELMEWQAIQNEKLFKRWLDCDDDLEDINDEKQ